MTGAIVAHGRYNAGADGVVVWGFTGDDDGTNAQGGPHLAKYLDYVNSETGPLVRRIHKHVAACGEKWCSGNGRCNELTLGAAPAADVGCQCFHGFTGVACGNATVAT